MKMAVSLWKQTVIYSIFCFAALPEEPVPGDAVVLQLASQSRRRRPLPPHQTRHLRVLSLLQEGRLRVQQPRHRLTGKKNACKSACCAPNRSPNQKTWCLFLPGRASENHLEGPRGSDGAVSSLLSGAQTFCFRVFFHFSTKRPQNNGFTS